MPGGFFWFILRFGSGLFKYPPPKSLKYALSAALNCPYAYKKSIDLYLLGNFGVVL